MVRFARPSEVSQVAALYHSVWHETQAPFMPIEERTRRTLAFFVQRMSALLETTLVERHSHSIVGFSAWRGHLLGQLYVAKAFRGTDVAPLLMATAEREMANGGIAEAELHCVAGNNRARRFYERVGWTYKGEMFEPVLGEGGEVGVAFWRMTKALCSPLEARSTPGSG